MEARRRKNSPVRDSNSNLSEPTKQNEEHRIPYLYLLLFLFIISLSIVISWLYLYQTEYAVVLDAGSTGSRVLIFIFYRQPSTGNLVLSEEIFEESAPGLSSYAADPVSGADSISSLLSLAKERIPSSHWSQVPVTLRATAGLRLLPPQQAEALLTLVQERLDTSGFNNKGVGMLSELDEGVFGWMTINYLMDQLHRPNKSYVALDLGGGSTQITFLPKYTETFSSSPSTYLHPIKVFSSTHTIYSHSYLGLGLMAAREAIFRYNDPEESTDVESPCMVTNTPTTWEFHGKVYTISPSRTMGGYEACMLEVQAVIDSLQVDQCEEVPTRKIAAFSYFHDRAVDAGLLSHGQSGVVSVQQFLDAAQAACSQPSEDRPFMCVDLSFIAGLLHHGYRLEAQALLGLYKKINGYQTSWALGAAFHMLD